MSKMKGSKDFKNGSSPVNDDLAKKTNNLKLSTLKSIENVTSNNKFFNNEIEVKMNPPEKKNSFTKFSQKWLESDLFIIDPSQIVIKKDKVQSPDIKEKNIESKLMDLSIDFGKALERNDKREFMESLNSLKKICLTFDFEILFTKLQEWKKVISNAESLSDLSLNYDNINKILVLMCDASGRDQAGKKSYGNLCASNTSLSSINDDVVSNNLCNVSKNFSTFTQSPVPIKRTLNNQNNKLQGNISQINIIKPDEDLIYQELKPVKFEGLYKKEMTFEEINSEITKMESESNEQNTTSSKVGSSSRKLKISSNIISDNAYPFKQDCFKLTCNIF